MKTTHSQLSFQCGNLNKFCTAKSPVGKRVKLSPDVAASLQEKCNAAIKSFSEDTRTAREDIDKLTIFSKGKGKPAIVVRQVVDNRFPEGHPLRVTVIGKKGQKFASALASELDILG